MQFRRLIIYLEKIDKNSYLELEKELGKLSGITCPGLDERTKKLEMTYEPKIISKEKILQIVKKLGYKFKNINDLED